MDEIKFVNWENARKHMEKGGKCRFNGREYHIEDKYLCLTHLTKSTVTTLNLSMLDSCEWELI